MNPKLIKLAAPALLSITLLGFTSCTTPPPPPPDEAASKMSYTEGVPGGVIVQTFKATATVTAIDQTTRKITLLGADGKKFTVKAGPDAVNLDQIRFGDQVVATVTKELVVRLDKEGTTSGVGGGGMVVLAEKGSQPGGLVAETAQVTATVKSIDARKRTATLRFDDGTIQTFPVREDVDLSRRKPGERVVFRVTEMIAIRVEKPQ